jgi:hypothetical protein
VKRPEPAIPDSEAIKRALLPARIAHWKKLGTAPELVAKLEAELLSHMEREGGVTTAEDGLRTAGAKHG